MPRQRAFRCRGSIPTLHRAPTAEPTSGPRAFPIRSRSRTELFEAVALLDATRGCLRLFPHASDDRAIVFSGPILLDDFGLAGRDSVLKALVPVVPDLIPELVNHRIDLVKVTGLLAEIEFGEQILRLVGEVGTESGGQADEVLRTRAGKEFRNVSVRLSEVAIDDREVPRIWW